jgi:uncharacterized protein (TIGR04255 family)
VPSARHVGRSLERTWSPAEKLIRCGYSSGINCGVTTDGEIFPNAPLALVAMEVRFPEVAPGPLRAPVLRAVKEYLGEGWVIEGGKQQTLSLAVPTDGSPPSSHIATEDITRLTVRDRTRVVTLRPASLTVEATRYGGYPDYRPLLETAFEAVERVLKPEGVARLGLRYIDEIQVAPAPVNWSEWIHSSLMAPHVEGLTAATWTAAAQYDVAEERRLVLRYGPSDKSVMNPGGPLKRPRPSRPWPVFVLDFDSFWEPTDIPSFEASALAAACDDLRAPVRRLFDQLLTDKLLTVFRDEVTA